MASASVSDLVGVLAGDAESPEPKYPLQARFALADKRVAKAVERRLGGGSALTGVRLFDVDSEVGLLFVSFEFAPTGGLALVSDGVLAVLDQDCKVVGIVDPFDPVQPNRHLVPRSRTDELPFALDRPSAGTSGTGDGPVTTAHAVNTRSQVGYKHVWQVIYMNARGPVYGWATYPSYGDDDSGSEDDMTSAE